ncbi:hypothetical protein QUF64_10745 [Anaerolineales bacterium HSG6]|nr:hypothetical protein [Anaerolineales bacterium HSG6]
MKNWLIGGLIIVVVSVIGLGLYHLNVQSYTVDSHAYGRRTGTHASSEAEVRSRVRQVTEWWYNPNGYNGQQLHVGLATPVLGGPTWLIFYHANQNLVNNCYFRPNLADARNFVNNKGYTIPVAISPIP